nr:pyruvate, orthophosphate dikinase1 [Tanacetum cinerariifolium]
MTRNLRDPLISDKIATDAEFFLYGTNDRTQMTFRYSLDDVGKFLPVYLAQGLLEHDPLRFLSQPKRGWSTHQDGNRKGSRNGSQLKAYSGNKGTSSKVILEISHNVSSTPTPQKRGPERRFRPTSHLLSS